MKMNQEREDQMIQIDREVKIYELWGGKNRFLFDGRIMLGPSMDCGANICAWTSLLVLPIIFYNVTIKELWVNYPLLVVVNIFLFLLSIIFLILTSITDPGYIPRRNIQEAGENIHPWSLDPSTRRFCETCRIYRPPRTSHCRDCDNCVLVLDHHCPFVNNCVGKRNYKFFFGFITSVFGLGCTTLVGVLVFTANQNDSNPFTGNFVYIFLVPIGIISLVLFGFLIYHICLRISGKTTREHLRGYQSDDTEGNDWFSTSKPLFNPRQVVFLKRET